MAVYDKALLNFLSGWRTEQQGAIRSGHPLAIRYDPSRLPQIRDTRGPVQVWDIEVLLKFHPSAQFHRGSVMQDLRDPPGHGPVYSKAPGEFDIVIPPGVTQIELWFRNYSHVSSAEQWDSRYSENYWFSVEAQ
jgi:Family of unknown function (DUF6209)